MQRAKMWWRAQQHDINIGIEQSLETVEAVESVLLIDLDLLRNAGLFGQRLQTSVDRFGKRIGDRNELCVWIGRQRLHCGARTTPAAAHQAKPQYVAAGCMHLGGGGQCRNGRARGHGPSGRPQKSPP